jgi:XapX domain-containing protein
MKPYVLSLAAGVLVGIIYNLMSVRSPAPPLVALIGLLGMLAGEQVIPLARHLLSGSGFSTAWRQSDCTNHILGALPGRHAGKQLCGEPTAKEGSRS